MICKFMNTIPSWDEFADTLLGPTAQICLSKTKHSALNFINCAQ